jgi:RNA polymerase sigma-70 factor, ECF subfamily
VTACTAAAAPGLLERVAAGDQSAFAGLYDRYSRKAYSLTLRIVRDAALAEDVVLEAFLSAWRSASSFRPGLHTEHGWLLSIVHRHAVDARRRHRRQLTPTQPPLLPTPEASIEGLAERDRIRRALAGLDDGERQVLELAYFDGLTESEIAAELAIPVRTVRSRTHHAVSRLCELLRSADGGTARRDPAPTG